VSQIREVGIERLDSTPGRAARMSDRDRLVIEAPLQLRARGTPVATIMRTPGHDLELVRGLLHAESVAAGAISQLDDDAVEIDVAATAFAGRGLLSSAACGVCGRVAIADLELRAREVTADTAITHGVLAGLPAALRAAQSVFSDTGGLHGAGLATPGGALVAAREDVGRHNAVDKVVGERYLAGQVPADGTILQVSGRASFEIVQKAAVAGIPIVSAVSAPSSLAVEAAERFGMTLVGFVRDGRANVYSHAERVPA
jgi:FdhD protein